MSLRAGCILIVDDELPNVRVLERILDVAGHAEHVATTDSRQALPLFIQRRPDLVLLDLNMPHLDGFEVLQQLRSRTPRSAFLPILILTGDTSSETRRRALAMGATDFLTKPFDAIEVQLRIGNLLATRRLHVELERQKGHLEEKVRQRTEELHQAELEIIQRLATAAEHRDDVTGQHIQRVGFSSALLARELGLPSEEVELIRRAAPLHDVGKIATPDAVLLKPGPLTPEEFDIIKGHTTNGARILMGSRFKLLQLAEQIALTHHERWDGKGYAGLQGKDIPLAARIVSVCDVYDALTHARPYKEAWPVDRAVAEIERQSGGLFDPRVAAAFLGLVQRGEIPLDRSPNGFAW